MSLKLYVVLTISPMLPFSPFAPFSPFSPSSPQEPSVPEKPGGPTSPCRHQPQSEVSPSWREMETLRRGILPYPLSVQALQLHQDVQYHPAEKSLIFFTCCPNMPFRQAGFLCCRLTFVFYHFCLLILFSFVPLWLTKDHPDTYWKSKQLSTSSEKLENWYYKCNMCR